MAPIQAVAALREIAAEQGALFSVGQARQCGATRSDLTSWRRRGWIRPVRRGAWAFTGQPPGRWEASVAAALAAGPEAVVSHRSAADIHGFPGVTAAWRPDLTIAQGSDLRLNGVNIHRTGPVDPAMVERRAGVLITSPAMTVVDLASTLDPGLLARVVDHGLVDRLWTVGMLEEALSRISPRRHGTRHLRQLLEHRRSEPTPDSPLEQRIYRHLQPLQPFVAHFQVVLGGRLAVLDAAWPEYRVAAEIDGRSWRAMSRSAHDRESRKLNALTAHRWSVAHLTTTMDQPECVGSVLELMPERAFPDVRARFGARVGFR